MYIGAWSTCTSGHHVHAVQTPEGGIRAPELELQTLNCCGGAGSQSESSTREPVLLTTEPSLWPLTV